MYFHMWQTVHGPCTMACDDPPWSPVRACTSNDALQPGCAHPVLLCIRGPLPLLFLHLAMTLRIAHLKPSPEVEKEPLESVDVLIAVYECALHPED
jgi:hypothetical protein